MKRPVKFRIMLHGSKIILPGTRTFLIRLLMYRKVHLVLTTCRSQSLNLPSTVRCLPSSNQTNFFQTSMESLGSHTSTKRTTTRALRPYLPALPSPCQQQQSLNFCPATLSMPPSISFMYQVCQSAHSRHTLATLL